MKSKDLILTLAITGRFFLSFLICSYFWKSNDLVRLQQIPISILALAAIYIGLQLLTRKLSKVQKWWDWVYYFGLLSIMLPNLLADESNQKYYHFISDYGTICLIIPAIIDGWNLIMKFLKGNK
jgi:hypothetical protein